METVLPLQALEHGLGTGTGVDHAQHLGLRLKAAGQRVPGELACVLEGHSLKDLPTAGVRWAQLHWGQLGGKLLKQGLQGRLGGGAQDGGYVVMGHQLGHGPDAGTEIGHREHLRFVKDNDAPS